MRRIKKIILKLVSLLMFIAGIFLGATPAFAQGVWLNPRCVTNVTTKDGTVVENVATIQGIECAFRNILNIIVPFVGLVIFFMLIAGAFQYLTSGGDAKKAQKAKDTITGAIFGLIAFFGAWFILILIKYITGVDVTIFNIPGGNP